MMGRNVKQASQILPLLLPRAELLQEQQTAAELHSMWLDQYADNNKFHLLEQALKAGSIESAKVLTSFKRPAHFNSAAYDTKKSYGRYLFATVLLNDAAAIAEFNRVVEGIRNKNDIYLLRSIITGYAGLGFELQNHLEVLATQFVMLGGTFKASRDIATLKDNQAMPLRSSSLSGQTALSVN